MRTALGHRTQWLQSGLVVFEVALALDALATLAPPRSTQRDALKSERQAILGRLGVVRIPAIPLPATELLTPA